MTEADFMRLITTSIQPFIERVDELGRRLEVLEAMLKSQLEAQKTWDRIARPQ